MAVASAGRLANGPVLRQQILSGGGALFGESDAELVAAHIARQEGRTLVNRLVAALHDLQGAWSLAIVSEDRLIVARDPRGFRPLVRGRWDGAYAFASEDTALRDLGCTEIQPVRPGEVIIIDREGARAIRPFLPVRREASLVDLVWLAREDARVEGESTSEVRLALGRSLAELHPVPSAAVVVGLPEAPACAIGFTEAVRRPYRSLAQAPSLVPFAQELGTLARSPGRYRASGVAGQEVALVLPGLVTAHEATEAVSALRAAGATRVHVRIAAPLPVEPDPYGVAMPPPEAWVATGETGAQTLADRLGADSAGALDLGALRAVIGSWEQGWCDTVWSGIRPVPIDERSGQLDLF
jgi:amidophosphoribosyltransferase